MRRERYDRPMRGRYGGDYDRGWRREAAYGRAPGLAGPGPFTPFGWDPLMRWGGWNPAFGFVPSTGTPAPWGYGLPGDARYDHDHIRGRAAGGYDRGYRVPPRESPMYGRGGDRAVREWARSRGYDIEHTIRPRRERGDR